MKNKNIPVFILAGGLGTRLSEETTLKPKPMVEIGDHPILLHVMRSYYAHGFNDFVICAGYRAWEIKQFFLTYEFRSRHLEIDHRSEILKPASAFGAHEKGEKWRVRVIDTGVNCMTGGRIARALDTLKNLGEDQFEDFAVTYGDGLTDADLTAELKMHQSHGKIGTVLGVPPLARFGELDIQANQVKSFLEKPQSRQGLINGGFFYFKRAFRDYLADDVSCILERAPLVKLADDGELQVFKHEGFWRPMDTLRDRTELEQIWASGKAPWAAKF